MSAVIFSGDRVRALKRALKLQDKATIFSDSVDPSSIATSGSAGDVFISTTTNKIYIKQDSGSSTNWDEVATSGTAANRALSNLITTSINQSLLPDGDSTRNLGSGALRWDTANVENIDAGSSVLSLDGTGITANSQIISNVGDPSTAQDAATKAYVDNVSNGNKWKAPVVVATTANITLSGEQTIDGIAVVTGDRVLVKDQSDQTENGIYVVDAGAWTRSLDADSGLELQAAAVFTQEGTQANKGYNQTSDSVVIGVTNIVWVLFTATNFSGHDMITISGGEISVDLSASSGLESTNPGNAAGQLQVKLNGATLDRSSSGMKITDGAIIPDSGGTETAIDLTSRTLNRADSSVGIDYANNVLKDTSEVNSLNYNSRTLLDSSAVTALNFSTRKAFNSASIETIDWQNKVLKDSSGTDTIDWQNGFVRTSLSTLAIDWINRLLYTSANLAVLNWQSSLLLDSSSVTSAAWGARELKDTTASDSIVWGTRKLVTGATTKLDWSGTNIDINTRKIINVVDPTANQDAATKLYVDNRAVTPEVDFNFDEGQTEAVVFGIGAGIRAGAIEFSVGLIADTEFYTKYRFDFINNGSQYILMQEFVGDDIPDLVFDITDGGDFVYSSGTYSGFSASSKFTYKRISLTT